MPSSTDRVFLVHPVSLGGREGEGAAPDLSVDTSRSIPVVLIGSRTPAAGDLVAAFAVGGRWVADSGASSGLICSPCSLPSRNLVISWTNARLGNGSTTLVYKAPSSWLSACTQQLLFSLTCGSSRVQLGVAYYLSGSCPDGQSQACVSPGSSPLALSLDAASCNPLYLHFTVTAAACPVLWNKGYSGFTITQ
ncbi:hypothetical protein OJF2_72420 [Aquisphaera giovannonii]|uniref:Uncharacterized protein n=2 Tax=Aquisphaera giovannonii TaxID=406548 RepID=A0A5B9WDE5_9BACT|nr:hypothetical protein OJF2_72420 [Aquisphaera giovannonii]